jgi:hypothetical protein
MEMNEKIDNDSKVDIVKSFILDVIKGYTKEFELNGSKIPGNWEDFFLGSGAEKDYLSFIANLMRMQFGRINAQPPGIYLEVSQSKKPRNLYSIVTLNYDLILEKGLSRIMDQYRCSSIPSFSKEAYDSNWNNVNLAKIHGCIEKDIIIAPTWNKAKNETIIQEWKMAKRILRDANTIRIVGYSLPDSDTYIKYLLGVAINENSHLENIEAICIDNDGTIESRYATFFSRRNFRFINSPFFGTFKRNNRNILGTLKNNLVIMDGLE